MLCSSTDDDAMSSGIEPMKYPYILSLGSVSTAPESGFFVQAMTCLFFLRFPAYVLTFQPQVCVSFCLHGVKILVLTVFRGSLSVCTPVSVSTLCLTGERCGEGVGILHVLMFHSEPLAAF